jgi:transposase-like protein
VVKAWRENWEYAIPFMAFPPDVLREIYTTNPIEALNRQLRKAIKTKGHFPNEKAAPKTHLPSHHQHHPEVDPSRRLDESPPGVQDPLRRPTTRLAAYTVRRTPSG